MHGLIALMGSIISRSEVRTDPISIIQARQHAQYRHERNRMHEDVQHKKCYGQPIEDPFPEVKEGKKAALLAKKSQQSKILGGGFGLMCGEAKPRSEASPIQL